MKERFISLVLTVRNDAERTKTLLDEIHRALKTTFELYEIIVVNNGSEDNTASAVTGIASKYPGKTVLMTLPRRQPEEVAIFAGLEFAMGDFVFDVEHLDPGFPQNIFLDLFRKANEGYDIVNIVPERKPRFLTALFYAFFQKVSHLNLRLETHSVRLVTRRALNALFKMKQKVRYRKAQYAYTGFKNITLPYPIAENQSNHLSFFEKVGLASDILISFSNVGLRFALILSSLFFTFSVIGGIFSIFMYFAKNHIVEGWTTLMLFSSFGFSGLFLLLSILTKYVITLLREVQQNPLYTLSDITVHSKDNS